MAKNSKIEWTEHTFNPWWGCTKVSPACDNCYAESWSKRTGHSVWGAKADRRTLSESHWTNPIRWNRTAEETGVRARVFCASMADVFEWKTGLSPIRDRLWALIEQTPNLDWLLLTKRPHLVERLAPWKDVWPENVWLGATIENQKFAEKRMQHLLSNPAKIRFLSCEPLLGPLDLSPWLSELHWVIAGGETGHGARHSHPDWFRSLRDQCMKAEVGFHFKQWGDWFPIEDSPENIQYERRGKKRSGRRLDGRTWDELPIGI